MATCVFFGHKDVSADIQPKLETEIINLIENKQVTTFYVGNNGNFDKMVYSVLKKIKPQYPDITYSVCLAYMPTKQEVYSFYDEQDTVVPDGVENGPMRYAISRRNTWMIEKADFVITHVIREWGGAAKYKEFAKKKKKQVINIK